MNTSRRILATILLLAACSKPGPGASDPAQPTQVANPASVHCEKQGGTLEIVKTPQGEQGICVLPDGVRCDEWAYFRKECPCGECPRLAPPAPGFCEGGTIVPGTSDACGCQSPPTCQK